MNLDGRTGILGIALMRAAHLLGYTNLVLASLVGACVVGVRTEQPARQGNEFCPPRWAAEDDALLQSVNEQRETLESDLPDGARALLPPRAARFSEGCTLSLPIDIEGGRCYLFAAQVFSRSGQPWALLRVPDPDNDVPRVLEIDHSMSVTFGEGADPLCFEGGDNFDAVVEMRVREEGSLVWVQAYEVTPEASERWALARRERLAAEALAAIVEPEPEVQPCISGDAGPAEADEDIAQDAALHREHCLDDAGSGDTGLFEALSDDADLVGARSDDAGPVDARSDDAGPVDASDFGDDSSGDTNTDREIRNPEAGTWYANREESSEVERAEIIEPLETIPRGPLAIELLEQCSDSEDNDHDGMSDCDDPDCLWACRRGRIERTPWLRTLDVRLGGAYRITPARLEASTSFNPAYDPLEPLLGFSSQSALVWRPSPYLGVGLDLGLAVIQSRSYELNDRRGAQNQITVLSFSLGLSLSVSFPVWIAEFGGTVGLGWLMLSTNSEERSLSGDDTSWHDNSDFDQTFHHPYGAGWLWVDFWVLDGLALGLYGGLLAPLTPPDGLMVNDYHIGVRTTLRLGWR